VPDSDSEESDPDELELELDSDPDSVLSDSLLLLLLEEAVCSDEWDLSEDDCCQSEPRISDQFLLVLPEGSEEMEEPAEESPELNSESDDTIAPIIVSRSSSLPAAVKTIPSCWAKPMRAKRRLNLFLCLIRPLVRDL
jgi:hypothetical protein